MGKSSKKSSKVDAAPAVVPTTKFANKKGKREVEVAVENQATAKKKQKGDVGTVQTVEKQKVEAKTQKKLSRKEESTSSEETDSSESDDEQKQKVDAAPALVPATKSANKKGKREVEVAVENQTTAKKKQKGDAGTVQTVEKQKVEAKTQKKIISKKEESTSSEETDSSGSEDEQKQKVKVAPNNVGIPAKPLVEESSDDDSSSDDVAPVKKAAVPPKKLPVTASKNGHVPASKGKLPSDSSDEESSEDRESEEDEAPREIVVPSKRPPATVETKKKPVIKAADSDDSSSDESDDEQPQTKKMKAQPAITTNVVKQNTKSAQKESSSEDGSSEESSDDEPDMTQVVKKAPIAKIAPTKRPPATAETKPAITTNVLKPNMKAAPKKSSSEDGSSEESSDDEPRKTQVVKKDPTTKNVPSKPPPATAETKNKADIKAAGNDDSSSDESDDEEPQTKNMKAQPAITTNVLKQNIKAATKASSSEDGSSEESSDDEPEKTQVVKKAAQVSNKSSESEEEDSSEESSEEEDDRHQPSDTTKKNGRDVEMLDTVAPKTDMKSAKKAAQTPVTPTVQTGGSKTLFVGNLSFSVEQADVENFFKRVGEVVAIRFSFDSEGAFKGYGHVEFGTAEEAQKALELNGQDLGGRNVKLDIARERGTSTPASGNERISFQKVERGQGKTIFVRGFDKSSGEDEVRSALEGHFGSCGTISRVFLPKEYGTDELKGFAYMDFTDSDCFKKALELSGSELEGRTLTVEEAKPRGDTRDSFGGGRSGRGRSGGRDGGRFSSRKGGRDGGGGRGRGGRSRPSMATPGTGKKKTFDD